MRRQREVILAASALLCLEALAGAAEIQVPEVSPEGMVAGPRLEELRGRLRGQPVVVEFWATWCQPCVAAIPHWNDLVEEFEPRGVRFLSVTDEKEEVIRRFLKTYRIGGWLALDTDRSMFDAFAVNGVPATMLIDAGGRVRAAAHPLEVDAVTLADLLAGRVPRLALSQQLEAEARVESSLLFQAVIAARENAEAASVRRQPGEYLAAGVGLVDALAVAYDVPRERVLVADEALRRQRYDFAFSQRGDEERLRRVLRDTIATALELSVIAGQRQSATGATEDVVLVRRVVP